MSTICLWLILILLLTLRHLLYGLFSRTTWVRRHHKLKTSLDLNEARDDGIWDGSGISWTICEQYAPHSRKITTPTPHHSTFYRPGALPDAQPTVSKLWRHIKLTDSYVILVKKHFSQFIISTYKNSAKQYRTQQSKSKLTYIQINGPFCTWAYPSLSPFIFQFYSSACFTSESRKNGTVFTGWMSTEGAQSGKYWSQQESRPHPYFAHCHNPNWKANVWWAMIPFTRNLQCQ